jgi:nitrogen fixation NifU-like protein
MYEIYGNKIVQHIHNPCHHGILIPADVDYEVDNPSCGDHMRFTLRFDHNQRIAAVGWSGESCAISRAAASMLSGEILGRTRAEVEHIGVQDLFAMLGTTLPRSRNRCVLLPFQALIIALYGHEAWYIYTSHLGDED